VAKFLDPPIFVARYHLYGRARQKKPAGGISFNQTFNFFFSSLSSFMGFAYHLAV